MKKVVVTAIIVMVIGMLAVAGTVLTQQGLRRTDKAFVTKDVEIERLKESNDD